MDFNKVNAHLCQMNDCAASFGLIADDNPICVGRAAIEDWPGRYDSRGNASARERLLVPPTECFKTRRTHVADTRHT